MTVQLPRRRARAGAGEEVPGGLGGRHSADAAHWDESGTTPIPVTELGARPTAGATRHRRPGPHSRIAPLDGLRGMAALVVVVYHVFLTQAALAAPYADPSAPVEGPVWWATFSPLHLFWAGPEAVSVFFVLSGLVLALPAVASGRLNLWDYYPRRLVRLYLPVWAAVGLALAWAAAVPRVWPEGSSWWIVRYSPEAAPSAVVRDLALVAAPGQFVHVLWSLQWEILYCLALPFVLLAVRRLPRWWPATLLFVVAAPAAGAALGNLALASLPLFVLGTLMAVEHRRLQRWARAVDRSRHAPLWWALLLLSCAGLLLAYWLVHALPLPAAAVGPAETAARSLQGLGAGLTVAVAWLWRGAHGTLTAPVMQWLGSRSFSLYLVHLPVVASVALLLGAEPPLVLVLAGTVLVTLPLTEVFYRLVERPSHRVARHAGRAVAGLVRSAPAAEVEPSAAETGSFRRIPAPALGAPVVQDRKGTAGPGEAGVRGAADDADDAAGTTEFPVLRPVRPRRAAPRPVAVHEPVTLARGFPTLTVLPTPALRAAEPAALFVPNVPVQAPPRTPPYGIDTGPGAPSPRRGDRDDREAVALGASLGR